jgi:CubicO group peptidase (beta-lactamase class C family)
MRHLAEQVAAVAHRDKCSGVVRVDRDGDTVLDLAFGLADRAHGVPVTTSTVFAAASVTKGITALVVMRLVEDHVLSVNATARSLLGSDLPLIADGVTVDHLLTHRSGIGDYFAEELTESIDSYVMSVPTHTLDAVEAYRVALDGFATSFPAGERFSYCNSGFVVLALLAERASGRSYFDLVEQLVCGPSGMTDTAFLRSDTTPANVARQYLHADGLRTNVLHMPLVGGGDGGLHTTTADLHALWAALFAGQVVTPETLAAMTTPRSDVPGNHARYGMGFWLGADNDTVFLEGYDAGISARTMHRPSTATTCTVLANSSEGAWPLVRLLCDELNL